jgi:hypothetical protein
MNAMLESGRRDVANQMNVWQRRNWRRFRQIRRSSLNYYSSKECKAMSPNRSLLGLPLCSLAILLLPGCSSSGPSPTSTSTTQTTTPSVPSAPAETTRVYAVVPQYNGYQQLVPTVWLFPASQTGLIDDNVAGFVEIAGSDVAVDGLGYVYSLSVQGTPGLQVASPSLTGYIALYSSISPATVQNMAVSPTGQVFLSDGKGVAVFDDVATGIRNRYIIGESQSGAAIVPGNITADGSGNLYVQNTADSSIAIFGPTADGTVVPTRTISGPLARLASNADQVRALTTDASGNLYVLCNCTRSDSTATDFGVFEFDPTANGNVAPSRFVTAPQMTPLGTDGSVAVDSAGTIYVDTRTSAATQTIFQFSADDS